MLQTYMPKVKGSCWWQVPLTIGQRIQQRQQVRQRCQHPVRHIWPLLELEGLCSNQPLLLLLLLLVLQRTSPDGYCCCCCSSTIQPCWLLHGVPGSVWSKT
jgi:hypothetical protein